MATRNPSEYCENCRERCRRKTNDVTLCKRCKKAGWRKCEKCGVLFLATDGRLTCLNHLGRPRYTRVIKKKYSLPVKEIDRFFILQRDDFRCIYCGKSSIEDTRELHVDHLIPLSKGGPATAINMITSCLQCNLAKHDTMLGQDVIDRIKLVVSTRNIQRNIADSTIVKIAKPRRSKIPLIY